jgi:hypothetical protein
LDGLISNSNADMKFWRMALTDSQTLIGRMVSLASLRRNLSALSFAIGKETQLSSEQVQSLKELLKPLTQQEISMENALTGELRFGAENWKTAPNETPDGTWTSRFIRLLWQPKASCNLNYRHTLKPALELSKLSSPEFYERAQTPMKPLEFSRFNPYNLGGKIDLSRNWQYTPYVSRGHDLAGIYSLVALQLELKANQPQDITAAIEASSYKNPYTQKPFDYEPKNKTLSFQCFDMKDVCSINI